MLMCVCVCVCVRVCVCVCVCVCVWCDGSGVCVHVGVVGMGGCWWCCCGGVQEGLVELVLVVASVYVWLGVGWVELNW